MNSEDKTFLERFCVTESSNLIDLENFAVTGFTIMGRLGWYSPHQPKMTKSPSSESRHQIFTSSYIQKLNFIPQVICEIL